jgi:hypothetical protein
VKKHAGEGGNSHFSFLKPRLFIGKKDGTNKRLIVGIVHTHTLIFRSHSSSPFLASVGALPNDY